MQLAGDNSLCSVTTSMQLAGDNSLQFYHHNTTVRW